MGTIILILSPFLFALLSLTLFSVLGIYGAVIVVSLIICMCFAYVKFDDKHNHHEQYDGKKSWDYTQALERFEKEVKRNEDVET